MRRLTAMLLGSVLLVSSDVLACSISGASVFRPSLERWDQHPGPAQKGPGSIGDYWEKVPKPLVRVVKITRGLSDDGSSCADAGTITLEISLPASSTYSINEFAFYFRVPGGQEPDEIFPSVPLAGTVEGDRAQLVLAWLDGHPARQSAIDLEVEVFLVTIDLSIGPSAFVGVKADKRQLKEGRPL